MLFLPMKRLLFFSAWPVSLLPYFALVYVSSSLSMWLWVEKIIGNFNANNSLMTSKLYLLISLFFISFNASAYVSPGTNQKLTLDNLVALSGGEVVNAGDHYLVSAIIVISKTDTLSITSNAVVKFAANTHFDIDGEIIINPPVGVTFTAQNIANGWNGMRIDSVSASVLRKLTFEYAVSMRIQDSRPLIDSCIFQFNNVGTSTTFGNGAIALFRGHPVITNSKFLNNRRAAIQGGSNITNTPKVFNSLFQGNNSGTTSSLPQINLGASGSITDSCKIVGNQFLAASIYSGAIGFLPTGNVYALIERNFIKKNRYGITFNGGSNINARVRYNVIDSNNTQGDPLLGGSGIAFSGGSATSHQNVIVTGNYIRWNLWGITIGPTSTGGGAKPNLGDLTNTDTSDDGKNHFINNFNNSSTPRIDLYNNNVDDIMAQGNYWGTSGANEAAQVEAKIFHKPDNAALGTVNYSNFVVPIELLSFSATAEKRNVILNWRTATESNSSHFEVERSDDSRNFRSLANVLASGNSSTVKSYSYTHRDAANNQQFFYRLKLVDKDGKYKHSQIVSARLIGNGNHINVYPTTISTTEDLNIELFSNSTQRLVVTFVAADGKRIADSHQQLKAGNNKFTIKIPQLSSGTYIIKFRSADHEQSSRIIVR
jgi:hypothetical protein